MMWTLRRHRRTTPPAHWIPGLTRIGALLFAIAVVSAGCSQRDPAPSQPVGEAGTASRAVLDDERAEEVVLQSIEGRWEAHDDLGTVHGLDVRWPVIVWSVDGQDVRQEWCALTERREDRLWMRCAEADPEDDSMQIPPSLAETAAPGLDLTERAFAVGSDGHLRLVPLAELAWVRSWIAPESESVEGDAER